MQKGIPGRWPATLRNGLSSLCFISRPQWGQMLPGLRNPGRCCRDEKLWPLGGLQEGLSPCKSLGRLKEEIALPLLPPFFHSVLPGNEHSSTETTTTGRSPLENVLHLGKDVNRIHRTACCQGETRQGNVWLFLKLSCRCLRWMAGQSTTRERPRAPPPPPYHPPNLLSHLYLAFKLDFPTCTHMHQTVGLDRSHSGWFSLPCFLAAVCSQ